MKERPILFSAPMVRALLDGTKTQTRRLVKLPVIDRDVGCELAGVELAGSQRDTYRHSPYGQPGDRLWVREEHRTLRFSRDTREAEVEYTKDGSRRTVTLTQAEAELFVGRKFPFAQTRARFMYRSYSRITLEITAVRVERLQAITEADAKAEGVTITPDAAIAARLAADVLPEDRQLAVPWTPATMEYWALWQELNAKRAPWASNPWVWVVEFRRVQP